MAYYERAILVPYLYNISSVELLCVKLQREYQQAVANKNKTCKEIASIESLRMPDEPQYCSYSNESHGAFFFTIVAIFFAYLWAVIPFLRWITGAIFLFMCFGAWTGFSMSSDDEKRVDRKNEELKQQHNQAVAQFVKRKAQINYYEDLKSQQMDFVKEAQMKLFYAQKLRDDVYAVNIIPSRYRDVKVACYLYDYFNTSRETDLDKILQTMLLDEINQKMDKVLYKMEEVIVNQRYQMALQEQQNQIAAENHKQEMVALTNLERNQELQTEYLQMIETNTAVSTFFAAADYFQTADYIKNRT